VLFCVIFVMYCVELCDLCVFCVCFMLGFDFNLGVFGVRFWYGRCMSGCGRCMLGGLGWDVSVGWGFFVIWVDCLFCYLLYG